MALILDTNALSAFAEGDNDLLRVIRNQSELALPAIVLGEYLFGIRRSRFQARYEQWLNAHLPLFSLLGVGRETAEQYAEIRIELTADGTPIPTNDLWIAALAREHRLTVASRDEHFQKVRGLRLVTW